MKLLPQISILAFLITPPLWANPIDTSVLHTDIAVEKCLDTAREVLNSSDFININVDDKIVRGNDVKKRYFASIHCESDNGMIFFAVSGADAKKRAQLMQALRQDDGESETMDESESSCVLQSNSTANQWKECDGEVVTLLGQTPKFVMQHPVLSHDFEMPSIKGKTVKRTVQSYMDIGSYQIILLAKTNITCAGEMQVEGVLEHIDLGGNPNTHNSYQGWSVQVKKFMCL